MTTRDGLKVLKAAGDRGNWSRHKRKSLRGQFLQLETDEDRQAFIRKVAGMQKKTKTLVMFVDKDIPEPAVFKETDKEADATLPGWDKRESELVPFGDIWTRRIIYKKEVPEC